MQTLHPAELLTLFTITCEFDNLIIIESIILSGVSISNYIYIFAPIFVAFLIPEYTVIIGNPVTVTSNCRYPYID
jgi:hypothetical protein